MLILNLADIGHGPVGIQDAIPADDAIWSDTRFELREPLSTDLEAHAVGEGVYVRGRIWTELDAACRRCLETVHLEVDEQLDLYFEPVGDRDEDDEDDEVYPLPADAKEPDLKPVILE